MSEYNVARTIVQAAMQGATAAHADRVEDQAWKAVEAVADRTARIAAVRFSLECGVLSVEHRFLTTPNRDLAAQLWNEFADEITIDDIVKLEPWRREIVETPRAQRPAELQWHPTRLRRANFPLRVARLQLGTVFGGEIEWDEIERDVDLEWDDGIVSDCGDRFRGWDSERHVYLETADDFEANERVARIAL